ncbi:MAG: aldehyde dehydrogenase family protein, partial [Deltaproteobacteria bacterium]
MADRFQIDNPFSGEIVAERRYLSANEVEGALARASRAQRSWARTPLEARIALCEKFCAAFEASSERIAREITQQMGKPLAQAKGEVRTCVARARAMIALAPEALRDDPLVPVPGFTRFVRHEPVGVVLDISAWNYPLLITVNVVVPAVLAGDSVPDHEVSAKIIARPEIGYVSFTGSVRGGHEIYREVGQRFIDAGLELGGKDPAYVAPDADFDHAVANLVDGAFYNAGQSCCGIERIYVHASVYDRFLEGALAEMRKQLKLGDPLDAATTLGPMAQPDAPPKLEAQVEEARSKGGRVLCGGKTTTVGGKGRFFDPCLIADASHKMHGLMVEESFGPIVGVAKVADDDDAVRLMNDSPYGLTASIWTKDQERAFRIGSQVETGTFFMNR